MRKINKKNFVLFFSFLAIVLLTLAVQAEVTVETKKETIVPPDTDGDGLLDENDPHPNIPEIYLVKDENLNGIVDNFEKN